MRLYAFYRSSASYRVRLGLAHKDIAHELVPIALMAGEQRAPEHRARNPIGQVPVLELLGGEEPVLLAQSVAILEYLEEVFPEPALLPREPIARARVRELVARRHRGGGRAPWAAGLGGALFQASAGRAEMGEVNQRERLRDRPRRPGCPSPSSRSPRHPRPNRLR
jgi:glutathione S-transferase